MKWASIIAVIFSLLLAGCIDRERAPQVMDEFAFSVLGGTVVTDPEQFDLKRVHLEATESLGRQIVVEGEVTEVSKNGTYLVLHDGTARLLVVLTDLIEAGPLLKEQSLHMLRVLGTVETGLRGMPYVRARSLNVLAEST